MTPFARKNVRRLGPDVASGVATTSSLTRQVLRQEHCAAIFFGRAIWRPHGEPPFGGSFSRNARKPRPVSTDAGSLDSLTRTERALLRVLFAQGGLCEDGHGALARSVDGGERSMQRATRRLERAGLLTITRRGYGRTAQMQLTEPGRRAAAELCGATADTPIGRFLTNRAAHVDSASSAAQSADTPIRRSPEPTAPARFVGNAQALNVARITARISHDDSPLGLARAYMAQIEASTELTRIASFLDEDGTLPVHATPTNLPELDEGLRTYFAAQARRVRAREQMRRMVRGVHVSVHDEE